MRVCGLEPKLKAISKLEMLLSLLLSSPGRVGFSKFELGSGQAFKFELRVRSSFQVRASGRVRSDNKMRAQVRFCEPFVLQKLSAKKMLTFFTAFALSLKTIKKPNQTHLKSYLKTAEGNKKSKKYSNKN